MNKKRIAVIVGIIVAIVIAAATIMAAFGGHDTPKPTDPTNTPTVPTTQGTDPTQDTEPTVPPTKPTDPDVPTNPTDPEGPTDPTDPTDPAGPTDPTDPTDPTEPDQPTDPTEPDKPTEPTEPVHSHDYKAEKKVEPTCTEEGYTLYVCECGDSFSGDTIEATGHEYGDWIVTKEPTCEKEGSRERICSKCGGKEKRTTGATGHTMGDETVTEATCTEAGKIVSTCTVCGKTVTSEIPAMGHAWTEWETIKEMVPNEVDGEQKRTCNNCGKEETRTIDCEHTRHNWEMRVVPGEGCTQNDRREWYCTECGCIGKTEGIPGTAPGHNWSEWETTKEPGPGVAGEEKRHCKTCGKEETLPLEPLDENGEELESYIDPKVETKEAIGQVYYRYGKIKVQDSRKTWGDYLSIVVNADDTVTVTFYNKEGERVEVQIVEMEGYDLTSFRINEDGTYDLYGFNGFN